MLDLYETSHNGERNKYTRPVRVVPFHTACQITQLETHF